MYGNITNTISMYGNITNTISMYNNIMHTISMYDILCISYKQTVNIKCITDCILN